MININRCYFFLLWALFSIFNSSYLLNFGPYIDPTLIMVVALSVLNTERNNNHFFNFYTFIYTNLWKLHIIL